MAGTTTIARNWKSTFGYLVGGLAALALSAVLFKTIADGAITVGIALIPGVLGVIFLYMAVGGSGQAACPSCGAQLGGLSTGANDGVLCEKCHAFVEGKQGTLAVTDPNRIADKPTFGTLLPAQYQWPQGCCVCGASPTQGEKVRTNLQNQGSAMTLIGVSAATGGAVGGRPGYTSVEVEVPHCASHKEGAMLAAAGGNRVRIRFRSYPYLRAFCQQNATPPG
ncbi:MAG: hypothetical protein ABI591_29665 [Kofleriaceae bacterium]